jgi:predicted Zn-dependent peptidase
LNFKGHFTTTTITTTATAAAATAADYIQFYQGFYISNVMTIALKLRRYD